MIDKTRYRVVINHEEQYSIVPEDTIVPRGFRDIGRTGTGAECMAFIEQAWPDMTAGDRERILRSTRR